jgi:hypothetical protein
MLTKRSGIVYALPPKRSRHKKKAAPADMPKCRSSSRRRDLRRIKRKPALTTRIIDRGAPDILEDEQQGCGEAADRLWQEIKRRVAGSRQSGRSRQDDP